VKRPAVLSDVAGFVGVACVFLAVLVLMRRHEGLASLLLAIVFAGAAAWWRWDRRRARAWAALSALCAVAALLAIVDAPEPVRSIPGVAVVVAVAAQIIGDGDASRTDVARLAVWTLALTALATAGMVAAVHQERAGADGWVSGWAVVCIAAIVGVSALGGLLVLRSSSDWSAALIWPAVAGWIALAAAAATWDRLGETESTGPVVASFLVLCSPITVMVPFIATFALKRLGSGRRSGRSLT
jgi:hypothetical protein